jgi:perosamine synthetase
VKQKIPLFKIYWDKEDIILISQAIERGAYWATGPNIEAFEHMIAEYIGTKYCLVFNSGTSALHAILLAYDIGPGDEVIVPSFTFIATANAPLFVGAKPVFADIEEETYGLDPKDVERKITSNTKAILPIHYGGSPCLVRELIEIADAHNLVVIEGGAIVTDSREIYEKLKLIRSQGRLETANYFASAEYMDYVTLGYNFRLSDISAALGIAQLKKVDKIIEMRRRNAEYMRQRLLDLEEIRVPEVPENYFHVYQMYTIRIIGDKATRDELMAYLGNTGIMTKVNFHPVHLTQFYQEKLGHKAGELPMTERVSNQEVTLPMYPTLTEEEIDYIGEQIKDFFAKGGSHK